LELASLGCRLWVIKNIDDNEEDSFVIVRDERDSAFLMLRWKCQVLLASFENHQIAKGLVEVLCVLINLPETFDDLATVLAALWIEELGICNKAVFSRLCRDQVNPARRGLRFDVKLQTLIVQVFVELSRQKLFTMAGIIFESGEHPLAAKPLAAVLKFFQQHQRHAFVIDLLINVIKKRLNIREPKTFNAGVVFAFVGEVEANLDFVVRLCGCRTLFHNPVTDCVILTLCGSDLWLARNRFIRVFFDFRKSTLQIVKNALRDLVFLQEPPNLYQRKVKTLKVGTIQTLQALLEFVSDMLDVIGVHIKVGC